ncbi:MAG: efflux RND transporter periplasmic adaptor subunit [Pseudomonadota bacterium]|jgi:membrane fusion protein (multidrug efflux system)|nr:efflux RND transporter periplasmic adaptor subunit [Pseudomonadota bacterium]NLX32342.1 efflux RND transporter periplasmic adaptor subunit [Deltaproteobacteria bacterium]HNU84537.1 efflux RND transporter periplasmic adaptor subunit [Syntrophales bacterium]HNZ34659.1 efflux RND transporter periplasmic adaptor subunit [Syntrophales bacterium]HOF74298.1 efflux RND transporter periplasmic adaptor subunit [Syntrophales bacterium]
MPRRPIPEFNRPCRFRAASASLLILAVFTLASCGTKEAKVLPEKAVNVQVETVQTRSLRPFIEAIGTLKAFEQVVVSSEIEGILRTANVEEGSFVSKGAVLAAVDDRDYASELRRVEFALKQAEATLVNAKAEHGRKETLYREELVTKQQFDDVATRLAVADAEVERSKAALAIAKERYAKTRILAPMAAWVSEKKISQGEYVRNGTPLYSLVQIDPLKLLFTVSEKDIGRLKVGQDVQFRVDAYPDREFTGKVSILYPTLDERTRSLMVEARAANPQRLLKPGLFTKVILYTAEARQTVVVPVTAILYEGKKLKVFIVEGDRARETIIQVGNKYDDAMEVTDGLRGGETLVVAGQQNLSEGAKLNVAR